MPTSLIVRGHPMDGGLKGIGGKEAENRVILATT